MAEEILIDFKVDYTELENAQKAIGKKVDTTSFDNLNKKISTTNKEAKGLIAEFTKVASTASKLGKSVENAFAEGVEDALKEAGISAEEFQDILTKANTPVKTLKQELKELKIALAEAKVNGEDFGEEFEKLRDRAGQVQDAIADANAEIKNAASDTRNIDNVVGSLSALAGGFAAAQGFAALFGEENEDLQKALLKVNAAIAISTGLQQVSNALQKEGALVKFADTVATGAQVAVQKIYTAVTGKATVATNAFKVALASTGIGLAVVAVIALVNAFDDEAESLDEVNARLDKQNELLEDNIAFVERRTNENLARLEAEGAAESKLITVRGQSLFQQRDLINAQIKGLKEEQSQVDATSKAWFNYYDRITELAERREAIDSEIRITNIKFNAQVKKEQEEEIERDRQRAKERKDLNDKRLAEARKARLQILNDELAAYERELLAVEEGTQKEIDLRKKVVDVKSRIDLEAEELTQNQKLLIQEQAFKAQIELQDKFNTQLKNNALQAQIDENAALLSGIEITEGERLRISVESIMAAAQIEINEAQGNAQKIQAIIEDRNAKIREIENNRIKQLSEDEIKEYDRANRLILKGLNEIRANRDLSANERISAVQKASSIEIGSLLLQLKAVEELKISDEDRLRLRLGILDQIKQKEEETADAIDDIQDEQVKKDKERMEQRRDIILDVLSQSVALISSLNDLASEVENQRIDAQRKQLDALVEAGAITEKEAEKRAKQLEIQERQARQRQAQRQKQEAVFNAVLSIPQAYLSGLKSGGPILGAIYAAIAAAQAAVIIARPVPKFFRGKKDNYQGLGEVGDMGPELVKRGSEMELYTKPTVTYLSAKDKVFTAAETRKMLHNSNLPMIEPKGESIKFDYDRLAKSIPKSSFSVNIDKKFITESVNEGLKNKYLDQRYKFN